MTPFNKNNIANFSGEKKSTIKLSGCLFFEKTRKNLVFVVALVLESEGLYLETDGLNETRSSYKLKVTNGEMAGAFLTSTTFLEFS